MKTGGFTVICRKVRRPLDEHQHNHVQEQEAQEDDLRDKFADDAQFVLEVPAKNRS